MDTNVPTWQNTLVIIKGDAIRRNLVSEIMKRFELAGLNITNIRFIPAYRYKSLWEMHYQQHQGKEFYDRLINIMSSNDAIAIQYIGYNSIERVRRMVGETNALQASTGTIRGDFGRTSASISDNLVHASDSFESAIREISLWFYHEDSFK